MVKFAFALSISFHQCPILIFIPLSRRTKGDAWELSKKFLFRKSGSTGYKSAFIWPLNNGQTRTVIRKGPQDSDRVILFTGSDHYDPQAGLDNKTDCLTSIVA
jgi:hypothetical protein